MKACFYTPNDNDVLRDGRVILYMCITVVLIIGAFTLVSNKHLPPLTKNNQIPSLTFIKKFGNSGTPYMYLACDHSLSLCPVFSLSHFMQSQVIPNWAILSDYRANLSYFMMTT